MPDCSHEQNGGDIGLDLIRFRVFSKDFLANGNSKIGSSNNKGTGSRLIAANTHSRRQREKRARSPMGAKQGSSEEEQEGDCGTRPMLQ